MPGMAVAAAGETSFVDLRPGAAVQRRLAAMADRSPRGDAHARLAGVMSDDARAHHGERSKPVLQTKSTAPIQRAAWTTGAIDGRETDVEWKQEAVPGVSGDQVGIGMTATLGPDHLQGGPPKSSAQKNLMGRLPTTPTLPANQKYIKGHLLNDNIGGPGDAKNLFPITAKANREHEQSIESKVKRWVNDEKRWVRYVVSVDSRDYQLASHKVSAVFNCHAAVLDEHRNPTGYAVRASISSQYEGGEVKAEEFKSPHRAMPGVRAADAAHKPLLSSRVRERKKFIHDNVRSLFEFIGTDDGPRNAFLTKLMAYKGIGAVTAVLVADVKMDTEPTKQQFSAYDRAIKALGGDQALVDLIEEVAIEFDLLTESDEKDDGS